MRDVCGAKTGILMEMETFGWRASSFKALRLCLPLLHFWIKACRNHANLLDKEGGLCTQNGKTIHNNLVIQRELDGIYTKLIDRVVEFL